VSLVYPVHTHSMVSILLLLLLLNRTQSTMKIKLKIEKYKKKMHKTHSHRQVNSVNYLELEQMAVRQLMISVHSRCISGTKMM